MGNTESNVTSGVKKQAGVSTQKLYKLVNLKGGGLLVDMMKRAINNKQFAEIDHAIKTKVLNNSCQGSTFFHIKMFLSLFSFRKKRLNHFFITRVVVVTFQLHKLSK